MGPGALILAACIPVAILITVIAVIKYLLWNWRNRGAKKG